MEIIYVSLKGNTTFPVENVCVWKCFVYFIFFSLEVQFMLN